MCCKVRTVNGSIHPITDEGRRVSDAHDLARSNDGVGRFLAIRLEDGRAEGDPIDIYDTRADLYRHWDDPHHAPLCVNPTPMPPAEGTHWLEMQRRLAAAGFKMTDPGTPQPIPAMRPKPPAGLHVGGGLVLPAGFAKHLTPHMDLLKGRRRGR